MDGTSPEGLTAKASMPGQEVPGSLPGITPEDAAAANIPTFSTESATSTAIVPEPKKKSLFGFLANLLRRKPSADVPTMKTVLPEQPQSPDAGGPTNPRPLTPEPQH